VIYLDSCALLKFIKAETHSEALRTWRTALPDDTDIMTSALARLEITRTLLRAGVDHQRVPYFTGNALQGLYLADLTTAVLDRAISYRTQRLGSLDAIHLATADPFRNELTEFVTYDKELGKAAGDLGFPATAPS
jgi:predicted nucleic acid-binding protein